MKATIKDVASKAGVAVSTVSRVINGKNRVSADTEKKVNDAIKELGYIKNNLAASIKSDKSHFVAVVVPDIRNEFYTAVIRGVESILSKEGYYTLVYTTKEVIENEETVFEGPVGQMVDGIILIPAQKDCRQYKKYGKPVVFIDRDLPDSNFCSVTVDNYNGVAILTEELIKNGQPWRLITCAFLHGGLAHIAFNMYALKIIGAEVEYAFGKVKYIIIYLISAIGSSIFSYMFNPASISVGASGAIFGLFGAMIIFGIRNKNKIGKEYIINLAQVVIVNIIIGIILSNIDNSAHMGGLVFGAISALILKSKKNILNRGVL